MSSTTESVSLSKAEIREAYNPFKHDCWADFTNKLTKGYMSEEPDGWYPIRDFHARWLEHFDGDRDFVLMCQRDGLKTTITLTYLIACLEYKEGFRGLWITNNRDQAFKKADTELGRMIRRNPWLTNLNAPMEQDAKQAKIFSNGSILYTSWLFGGIEGDRAHLLILDDLIKNQGDGSTESVDEFIGTVVPIVKDGGRTAIIGTRKRADDIYSVLQDRPGYDLNEYPAILDIWDQQHRSDDDWQDRRPDESFYSEIPNPFTKGGDTVQVLWPEARGGEFLRQKYDKMGSHRFYREYCLSLIGGSGDLVDESDLNVLVDDGGCSIRGQEPPRDYTPRKGEAIVVGHDPAQSKTGDNAAFVVYLVQGDGRRKLLDAHAEKGMSPTEIKAKLADYNDRYDPARIVIEDNGMQQYVTNDAIEMNADMRAKVTGMTTTGRKHSWENGIPRLQTLVENGSLLLYRGHAPTEEFVTAILSLSLEDGRLTGHTPDIVAAWYMAEMGVQDIDKSGNRPDHHGVRSLG